MALATTCPQCKTSFKVVPDQLKLRRGLVRCGVCQHVFSGIDSLRYVDDATGMAQPLGRHTHEHATAPAAAKTSPGSITSEPGGAPAAHNLSEDRANRTPSAPISPPPAWPDTHAGGPQTVIDPDNLKTAFFLSDSLIGPLAPEGVPTRSDSVTSPASHDPLAGPPTQQRSRSGRLSGATPSSVREPERARRRSTPAPPPPQPELAFDLLANGTRPRLAWRSAMSRSPRAWAAAIALAGLMFVQALFGWRDSIAAHAPALAPVLKVLLAPFGANIQPPRDLDAVTIESFELQTGDAPNALNMQAVLRNHARHPVRFPAMELTLTDATGRLLLRKVIPVDVYLHNDPLAALGLEAGIERSVKLAMEHDGLQPAGFSVALFYP
jgi:predicted Zn finger-like uncharacterized protein